MSDETKSTSKSISTLELWAIILWAVFTVGPSIISGSYYNAGKVLEAIFFVCIAILIAVFWGLGLIIVNIYIAPNE